MNSISDLGGLLGFGPVRPEPDEPVWHEPWERVVFAIQYALLAQGVYNLDEARRTQEAMDPVHYLTSTYYERWLRSEESLLLEKGVLTPGELDERQAAFARGGWEAVRRESPELAELVATALREGHSSRRDDAAAPRFRVGDRVRARNINPRGHNRLPRYARGKRGVIDRAYGPFVFADTHAHGGGEQPQPLYCVRFEARELWGDDAEPGHRAVSLDLWESYLEAD